MTLSKKFTRILYICIAIILCVFLASMGVIYWFLQRDPDELANRYLASLSERTGLVFRFEALDVTLLPLPAIALSNISIQGKGIDFKLPLISVRPSFPRILRGNFFPGSIILLRPKLFYSIPCEPDDLEGILKHISSFLDSFADNRNKASANTFTGQCDVDIIQARMEIRCNNQSSLTFYNVRSDLSVSGNGEISGETSIGSLRIAARKKMLLSLDKILLDTSLDINHFFSSKNSINLTGYASAPGIIKKVEFGCNFSNAINQWTGRINITGDLDLDNIAVPVSITGNLEGEWEKKNALFKNLSLRIDRDQGEINGKINYSPHNFLISGNFRFNRLSLTQWLGIFRNLTPGLQNTLDNVTNASADFNITATGLNVTNIKATCNSSVFTGKGGVEKFSVPVVSLNLKTDSVNLGLGLPESLGKTPTPPKFPYSPLTPMPGTPLKPGEQGIGYNINLHAEKIIYGPLTIGKSALRIYPGQMDRIGIEDVLLDAQATFYGGKVIGNCILGAAKEMPVNIVLRADNINGTDLGKTLHGFPVLKGNLSSRVNVFSSGKELASFLKNLHGTISVKGENTSLRGYSEKFSSLEAKSTLEKATLSGSELEFTGKWHLLGTTDYFNAKLDANGKLAMNWSGVKFKNIPVKLQGRILKELFGIIAGTDFTSSGNASFSKDIVDIQNAQIKIASSLLKTSFRHDLGKLSWNGEIQADIPSTRTFLSKFGFKLSNLPPALTSLTLQSSFNYSPGTIALNKMKAHFAGTELEGSINWRTVNSIPDINFSISSNEIDLKKLTGNQASRPSERTWDLNFLKTFNANGIIKVKLLHGFGMGIQNLEAPIKAQKGNISIGPATARFYGAPLQLRCFLDFKKGLAVNTIVTAHDFDLGAALAERKMNAELKGKVNLDISLNAYLTKPGQLPGALNGTWNFMAKNGSWQAKKNGDTDGKPIQFSIASASGKLHSGVLDSRNILLKGPDMEINGSGILNLDNRRLDCDFNVNMKGLPDFPLRLYGNLSDIKTSIGAGKMMLNALTGLTSGIFHAIGGIFEGAWNLFK